MTTALTRDHRIGVLLFQHECNSFAPGTTERSAFTIMDGATARSHLDGASSEYVGAADELDRLGATPVPLVWAHALPSAPLSAAARRETTGIVLSSIDRAGHLDGLVVALHGAASAEDAPLADAELLGGIRRLVGPSTPIAVTLDLHGNPTAELIDHLDVLTGYRTNPHVDLTTTGIRAARLLARVLTGTLRPVVHLARCPAIFPDECLRTPDGPLARVVARATAAIDVVDSGIVDISTFPTQPWLDAPGVGFTAVVTGDGSIESGAPSAHELASRIAADVWTARGDIVAERPRPPADAVTRVVTTVRSTGVRPGVVAESADAPTAGAAGDGTGVLTTLLALGAEPGAPSAAVTVRDPAAVAAAAAVGIGGVFSGPIGATIDPRWTEPVDVVAIVDHLGSGTYRLVGAGYGGMTVDMGRHAVLRAGALRILVTELAAWSADPATWRHAGIEPSDVEVLVVKSCTDHRANFPAAAPFSETADVPGPATSDLTTLRFRFCTPPPYPAHGWDAPSAAFRSSDDG